MLYNFNSITMEKPYKEYTANELERLKNKEFSDLTDDEQNILVQYISKTKSNTFVNKKMDESNNRIIIENFKKINETYMSKFERKIPLKTNKSFEENKNKICDVLFDAIKLKKSPKDTINEIRRLNTKTKRKDDEDKHLVEYYNTLEFGLDKCCEIIIKLGLNNQYKKENIIWYINECNKLKSCYKSIDKENRNYKLILEKQQEEKQIALRMKNNQGYIFNPVTIYKLKPYIFINILLTLMAMIVIYEYILGHEISYYVIELISIPIFWTLKLVMFVFWFICYLISYPISWVGQILNVNDEL